MIRQKQHSKETILGADIPQARQNVYIYITVGSSGLRMCFKASKNMKRSFLLILSVSLILCCLCGGCRRRQAESNKIFVTIAPLKSIVESIVGDDFDIEILVPQGSSPETFSPSAKQYSDLNASRLIFGTGLLEFEKTLLDRIEDQTKVVDLSSGIELIEGSCSHHHCSCGHGKDPHIWCSARCLQNMAENAFDAIRAAMPDSVKYATAYDSLCERLLDLDEYVSETCRLAPHSYFIIYHPAMTYFARDCALEQVAVENEGKEPGLKAMGEIIERARHDGISKVYYQSEFPKDVVQTLCSDIGATAVEINPLQEDIMGFIRDFANSLSAE